MTDHSFEKEDVFVSVASQGLLVLHSPFDLLPSLRLWYASSLYLATSERFDCVSDPRAESQKGNVHVASLGAAKKRRNEPQSVAVK
jgi:hypothetical protein